MAKLPSYKFSLAVLAVVSASVLVWFSKIGDGVYATAMVSTVTAYMTANWAVAKDAKKDAP